ncbi:MAG: arginase family protein [Thaumarchaeota archaeon]|nr:arginase family protein [Nitrososphaerota archaeon]GFN39562.1 MAG: agmatinase [Marine Group I thaumarchaeote]
MFSMITIPDNALDKSSVAVKKICWANTEDFNDSNIVLVGVPDESQSHALRKGTSAAPDRIREISVIRDMYIRNGEKSLGVPFSGLGHCKLYDYGNIERDEIDEVYEKIISKSKIPLLIGGDHSISTQAIKSVSKRIGPISLVYFDAHPDFVSSTTGYYGSVFHEVLQDIDIKTSLQIGIRTPEQEELENLKKFNIKVFTPMEIAEKGVKEISESIAEIVKGNKVYISFDMDCVDPSFAPGVSVPVPLGLRNVDAVYLMKSIVKNGIVGMDIMEVCPNYDIKDRTSHLASRMISEILSSCRL